MAMKSLPELETVTFDEYGDCLLCGAIVFPSAQPRHVEYHKAIVAWLRALRDGKVDCG